MKVMWDVIKYTDMFTTPVALHLNGSPTYTTKLSGFSSIIATAILIFGWYIYLKETLIRTNPIVSSVTYQDLIGVEIDFSPSQYHLAIGLENRNTRELRYDPSIYTLQAWKVIVTKTSNTGIIESMEKKPIKIIKCSILAQYAQIKDYHLLQPNQRDNLMCLENPSNFPIEIKASENSEKYEFIQFMIRKCDGETSEVECQPDTVITKFINESNVLVKCSDIEFNYQLFDNPLVPILREFRTQVLNFDLMKNVDFYYRNLRVISASGLVTPYEWNLDSYFIATQSEKVVSQQNKNDLIQIQFRCDEFQDERTRVYRSFLSTISDMGGFTMITCTLFKVINSHIGQILLYLQIIKKTFRPYQQINNERDEIKQSLRHNMSGMKRSIINQRLNDGEEQRLPESPGNVQHEVKFQLDEVDQSLHKQIDGIVSPEKKINGQTAAPAGTTQPPLQGVLQNKKLDLNKPKQNTIDFQGFSDPVPINKQNTIKRLDKVMKRDEDSFQLNIKELFEYLFSCLIRNQSDKLVLIEKSIQKIQENIDVSSILIKLSELDKLKTLMLSERQLVLFNYISKPVIEHKDEDSGRIKKRLESISHFNDNFQTQSEIIQKKVDPDRLAKMALDVAKEMFDQNDDQLSEIDKRILDSLHPEIQEIFEEKFRLINEIPNSPRTNGLGRSSISRSKSSQFQIKNDNQNEQLSSIQKVKSMRGGADNQQQYQQSHQQQQNHSPNRLGGNINRQAPSSLQEISGTIEMNNFSIVIDEKTLNAQADRVGATNQSLLENQQEQNDQGMKYNISGGMNVNQQNETTYQLNGEGKNMIKRSESCDSFSNDESNLQDDNEDSNVGQYKSIQTFKQKQKKQKANNNNNNNNDDDL